MRVAALIYEGEDQALAKANWKVACGECEAYIYRERDGVGYIEAPKGVCIATFKELENLSEHLLLNAFCSTHMASWREYDAFWFVNGIKLHPGTLPFLTSYLRADEACGVVMPSQVRAKNPLVVGGITTWAPIGLGGLVRVDAVRKIGPFRSMPELYIDWCWRLRKEGQYTANVIYNALADTVGTPWARTNKSQEPLTNFYEDTAIEKMRRLQGIPLQMTQSWNARLREAGCV